MTTQQEVAVGQQVYEVSAQITGTTDYGVSLDQALAGPPPPEGIRIDVAFDGRATGMLSGRAQGVDYSRMRADGRFELDIHGLIETDDGARIAFTIAGAAAPEGGGIIRLFEYVTAHSAFPQYAWVNALPLRGEGTVDGNTGQIRVRVYAA